MGLQIIGCHRPEALSLCKKFSVRPALEAAACYTRHSFQQKQTSSGQTRPPAVDSAKRVIWLEGVVPDILLDVTRPLTLH